MFYESNWNKLKSKYLSKLRFLYWKINYNYDIVAHCETTNVEDKGKPNASLFCGSGE